MSCMHNSWSDAAHALRLLLLLGSVRLPSLFIPYVSPVIFRLPNNFVQFIFSGFYLSWSFVGLLLAYPRSHHTRSIRRTANLGAP